MATFILVRMEAEEEDDSSCTSAGSRAQLMQQLGDSMWRFLLQSIPQWEAASHEIHTILTSTTHPVMVLLLRTGSRILLTGTCWDHTVTSQDGCEWIHASMYSLAFSPSSEFPWSRIPAFSKWDVDASSDVKKQVQDLQLAFAMGMHGRLGKQSLIFKVLNSDVIRFVHVLCFSMHLRDVQSDGVKHIIEDSGLVPIPWVY